MRLQRLNAFQSWLVESGQTRVAIDPWLVGELVFSAGRWMYRRSAGLEGAPSLDSLAACQGVLMSSHFGDHLHMDTLRALSPGTALYGSPATLAQVASLEGLDSRCLQGGGQVALADLNVEAITSAFPYRATGVGFQITERRTGKRLFIEPHVASGGGLEAVEPGVDLVLATVETVRVLGVLYSGGVRQALEMIRALRPGCFVPTGCDPGSAGGLVTGPLAWISGGVEELAGALADSDLQTRLATPAVGEWLEV